MELKEIIEQEKTKIAEALKSVGYVMSDSININATSDDCFICITMRREE